tara:strand:- start:194 stop:1045 length:852 start_codon:yes stop_codon:yes gene_type:complete
MHDIILYCKSYSGDVQRVKKLKSSIEKYNRDNIPFYISCPKKDKQLFEDTLGKENYTLILDEDIVILKYPELDGWRSQQIVKSSLHKLNITKNYLCLDSDAYFITDFYRSDFLAFGDIPYTIIHENKEISQYKKLFFNSNFSKGAYKETLDSYRNLFGSPYKKMYDYGPNPYIWSCEVWKHFEEHYLTRVKTKDVTIKGVKPKSIDLEGFMAVLEVQHGVQMREAIIYGEYLLNTQLFEIVPTGPLFKVYHWKEMVEFEQKTGLFNEEKLAESYLGIIYQSKI